MDTNAYKSELKELQAKLEDPAFYSSKSYPQIAKRIAELEDIVSTAEEIEKLTKQQNEAQELLHGSDDSLKEIASNTQEEIEKLIPRAVSYSSLMAIYFSCFCSLFW